MINILLAKTAVHFKVTILLILLLRHGANTVLKIYLNLSLVVVFSNFWDRDLSRSFKFKTSIDTKLIISYFYSGLKCFSMIESAPINNAKSGFGFRDTSHEL